MRRREFIGLVGGGAVAPLLTPALRATAQQNAKIPRFVQSYVFLYIDLTS
jgi:hypothetical protein